MVFKQKTQEETHWIGEWAPRVTKLNGASENPANVHFIDNIASGDTACARSSRWLWQQREGPVVPPLLPSASMANLQVSPYGKHVLLLPQPLLHCGWAHASAEETRLSHPQVQAGNCVCSPGTAAPAGATMGLHKGRREMGHHVPVLSSRCYLPFQ